MQNPVATLMLAGALLADAGMLPSHPAAMSSAGEWISQHVLGHARATGFWRPDLTLYAVREPTGIRFIDDNSESWDDLSTLIQTRPQDVIQFAAWHTKLQRGLWALTEWHESRFIRANEMASKESEDLQQQPFVREARAAYVDRVQALVHPWNDYEATTLRTADMSLSRPLWTGYIHNIAALAAVVLFLYSLAWLPRAPAYLARTRSQRRLARGQCPHCGYSIAGLTDTLCPECGKGWNLTAEDEPAGSESAT